MPIYPNSQGPDVRMPKLYPSLADIDKDHSLPASVISRTFETVLHAGRWALGVKPAPESDTIPASEEIMVQLPHLTPISQHRRLSRTFDSDESSNTSPESSPKVWRVPEITQPPLSTPRSSPFAEYGHDTKPLIASTSSPKAPRLPGMSEGSMTTPKKPTFPDAYSSATTSSPPSGSSPTTLTPNKPLKVITDFPLQCTKSPPFIFKNAFNGGASTPSTPKKSPRKGKTASPKVTRIPHHGPNPAQLGLPRTREFDEDTRKAGPRYILKDYQRMDVNRIKELEETPLVTEGPMASVVGNIVAYVMGGGKTFVAMALIVEMLAKDPNARPTLVLCPSENLMRQWRDELRSWAPDVTSLYFHKLGGASDFEADITTIMNHDVVLATYHQLQRQHALLVKMVEEKTMSPDPNCVRLFLAKWHRVILDEAHTIRNPDSKKAKACWTLQKKFGLCLTGTPIQNTPSDLYPLLRFLGVVHRGIRDRKVFEESISRPMINHFGRNVILDEILRPLLIRRGEEVVELTERHLHSYFVGLTWKEAIVYNYVLNSFPCKCTFARLTRQRQVCSYPPLLTKAVELETDTSESSEDRSIEDTTEQLIYKLSQLTVASEIEQAKDSDTIASIPAELEDVKELFEPTYVSSKIQKALDVLVDVIFKRSESDKTIIFSWFLGSLGALGRCLEDKQIGYTTFNGSMSSDQRAESLKELKSDDKCRVILMSIQAGGQGLNITSCNNVILLDPWWNPFIEEQAFGRVHRIGQTKEVHLYRLIVEDSIEERMVETQMRKYEMADNVYMACDVATEGEAEEWLGSSIVSSKPIP